MHQDSATREKGWLRLFFIPTLPLRRRPLQTDRCSRAWGVFAGHVGADRVARLHGRLVRPILDGILRDWPRGIPPLVSGAPSLLGLRSSWVLCSLVNPSSPKSNPYYQRVLKRREARDQLCGICLATRPGGDRQKRHLLGWEWWFDRRCFDPQGRASSFQSSVPRSVCLSHTFRGPLPYDLDDAVLGLCCAVLCSVQFECLTSQYALAIAAIVVTGACRLRCSG